MKRNQTRKASGYLLSYASLQGASSMRKKMRKCHALTAFDPQFYQRRFHLYLYKYHVKATSCKGCAKIETIKFIYPIRIIP